jgi:hypothetical protein
MTKRILVVSGDSLGHFFLAADGSRLTFGEPPDHAEVMVRGLRVTGIRCEVEADDEVVWRDEASEGGATEQPLTVGQALSLGPLQMRLEEQSAVAVIAATEEEDVPEVEVETIDSEPFDLFSSSPAAPAALRLRLKVVDGADKNQTFLLPEKGEVIVGNSAKSAAVVLHDLYVSPMHCRLDVDGQDIVVKHLEGKTPTKINGQSIPGPQALGREDTLRVGNSHLKLEVVPPEELPKPAAAELWPDEVQHSRVLHQKEMQTATAAPPPPPAAPASAWPPHVGQCIGHYRLGELLGQGHCGVAFRAEETKTGTVVTLKVLAPEFPSCNEELQQFARALKAAPHLVHAHLLTLHGAGKTGPLSWIAREHVEGESVAQYVQKVRDGGKASWTRAARVAIHLARTLRFLHKHKVVHGNITPNNVLIRAGDKQTKLADLMLVKALNGSVLQQSFLKKKLLAEAPYLAPEQTRAGAGGDEATDLYALGAVAYALATGRAPFAGETPEQIIDQVAHTAVPRPSKYQKGIPANFEAVLLKLLAKRQEDRYATADLLLGDLEPIAMEHGTSL